ncbi:hypothetical protein FB451DRAFT_1197249 [Mycena latifolia]|nr:hypothetical protein FB451DRAFT_1197249 [Mycena latifolia]
MKVHELSMKEMFWQFFDKARWYQWQRPKCLVRSDMLSMDNTGSVGAAAIDGSGIPNGGDDKSPEASREHWNSRSVALLCGIYMCGGQAACDSKLVWREPENVKGLLKPSPGQLAQGAVIHRLLASAMAEYVVGAARTSSSRSILPTQQNLLVLAAVMREIAVDEPPSASPAALSSALSPAPPSVASVATPACQDPQDSKPPSVAVAHAHVKALARAQRQPTPDPTPSDSDSKSYSRAPLRRPCRRIDEEAGLMWRALCSSFGFTVLDSSRLGISSPFHLASILESVHDDTAHPPSRPSRPTRAFHAARDRNSSTSRPSTESRDAERVPSGAGNPCLKSNPTRSFSELQYSKLGLHFEALTDAGACNEQAS